MTLNSVEVNTSSIYCEAQYTRKYTNTLIDCIFLVLIRSVTEEGVTKDIIKHRASIEGINVNFMIHKFMLVMKS